MKNGSHPPQSDAFGLFPDLMKKLVGTKDGRGRKKSTVRPPPIPDLSWIRTGILLEEEQVKNVPMALVLMGEERADRVASACLADLGYRVEVAESSIEGLVNLRSKTYATVLMHAEFGGESLAESTVYNYIKWLPGSKRRNLFFILAGPGLRTLYNLEALGLSANLVINDTDIKRLKPILKKSFLDHEELFGPLLEALKGYGKVSAP